MSDTRFLEYLDIENFKCFKHLKVPDLGRVNLIGGDNNVGKTAFLETGYINCTSRNKDFDAFFNALKSTVTFRNYANPEKQRNPSGQFENVITKGIENFQDFTLKSNLASIRFQPAKKEFHTIFNVRLEEEERTFENIAFEVTFITGNHLFLPSFTLTNDNLAALFDAIQSNDKETFLNESLNFFDARITKFKFNVRPPIPICYLAQESYPLASFGGGLSHFIAILCAIWVSKNGQLFIDEIENGIHYTKYAKLWELIFKISQEANCQVFATTHSKECIEAFSRVQWNEHFLEEARNTAFFEFARAKRNGEIFASKIERDELCYALTHHEGVRGE